MDYRMPFRNVNSLIYTQMFRIHVVVLLALSLLLAGCTRPPEIVGIVNPEIPLAAAPDVKQHKIFMTTTREASDVIGVFYSGERAPELSLASVDVTIPPTHVIGQLERPTRLPPDPRTEFTIINPSVYQRDATFIREINRELTKRPPSHRNILFFVHGYNNTTTDAILRLGQFVEDSDFKGVPVLMSWASSARTQGYVYDLNSALVARTKIKEIGAILSQTNAREFSIFAHSMGSLLAMEGLVEASISGRLKDVSRLESIMLASPDVDIDLFQSQLEDLPKSIVSSIFVLTSSDDSALRASRRVAGGVQRVGSASGERLEALGVTAIDLSEISDSQSGSHSKFTGSPEVVQIIGEGLNQTDRFGQTAAPPLEKLISNTPIRVFN